MSNKKQIRKNVKKRLVSVTVLLSFVAVVSLYLYQSFTIELLMKDLHRLQEQKKELLSATTAMKADVDRLSNIDRIERIASSRFGMYRNADEPKALLIEDAAEWKRFARKLKKSEQQKSYQLAGAR